MDPLYHKILVPVEGAEGDRVILSHVAELARSHGAHVLLFHVADGWAARYYRNEAASREIEDDRRYLETLADSLRAQGIPTETQLAFGSPATEIIKEVEIAGCDLIAMATHGLETRSVHRYSGTRLYILHVTVSKWHNTRISVLEIIKQFDKRRNLFLIWTIFCETTNLNCNDGMIWIVPPITKNKLVVCKPIHSIVIIIKSYGIRIYRTGYGIKLKHLYYLAVSFNREMYAYATGYIVAS